MRKNLGLIFILTALFWACKHKEPIPTPPAVPEQYGTPFASVPDRQDAAIYQVNMRAFSTQGDFAGVIARLDSIADLGINVVYLMPIYPVGTINAVNSPLSAFCSGGGPPPNIWLPPPGLGKRGARGMVNFSACRPDDKRVIRKSLAAIQTTRCDFRSVSRRAK